MLEKLFRPQKIAVVGASRDQGKTGRTVFDNLKQRFEGEVVPVNPKADRIGGEKSYSEIPEGTDLAVIAVPAKIVPEVMKDAGKKKVEAAVVISAGFSETGQKELEEQVVRLADKADIDLLGPNVLGLINTENMMNASFAGKIPEKGNISFMSQSGAFCTAILDYAKAEHIGFRHFVSVGNKAMIGEIDLLQKWRNDETDVILSYTEGIDDGRIFMKEAEKTSEEKPIVMVKSGRTDEGGDAASSHTGSLAGNYQAYQAAFRKAGIVEAESSRELLDFGRAFSYQPLPEGKKVGVVTNAGGPGVITTDEIASTGLELGKLSENTKEQLKDQMPEEASIHNPLDVIGDADCQRYMKAVEALLDDPNIDGLIVLLTPQANTHIKKTAEKIAEAEKNTEKPVFACFMGEKDVSIGKEVLEKKKVPEFEDPVDAVKTFEAMNSYKEFLETERTYIDIEPDIEKAERALNNYSGYTDGNQLLEAYGFKTPETQIAEDVYEAKDLLMEINLPSVLKLDSPDVSHKTEIKGVKKGVESREEAEKSYKSIVHSFREEKPEAELNGVILQEQVNGLEVALGLKRDPQFGPMVLVGLGGIYIEALHDVAFGIAPISEEEADRMIHELRSSKLFEGVRGEEHSLEPVKKAIIRLGQIGLNHPEIQEIDINPFILQRDKGYAADIEVEKRE